MVEFIVTLLLSCSAGTKINATVEVKTATIGIATLDEIMQYAIVAIEESSDCKVDSYTAKKKGE